MKAIYSACWADPWIKVAKKMKLQHNIQPVYWVGYEADQSEILVPNEFPDIVYQRYYDAWKGIFPQVFASNDVYDFLDVDFLKMIAPLELQAIKMMDRMDPDRHSFSFSERQRHFRLMIRKWMRILDIIRPDVIINATVPHRVYDYILFLLAKHRNIAFLAFCPTAFTGRIIPVTDIYHLDSDLEKDFILYDSEEDSSKVLLNDLPKDIRERYAKLKKDYETAEPLYMKRHVDVNKKESGFWGNVEKVLNKFSYGKRTGIRQKDYMKGNFPSYHKKKNVPIELSQFSFWEHIRRKKQAMHYKKQLKNYYNSLAKEPDLDKKFVFFPLHYQPEMTTNPAGDIFADQMLCLDVLLKNLPNDYVIYVKEHKSQFYAHTEGHTGRFKELYDDIIKLPRTQMIPLDTDVFQLIDHATAVATVTGTVGWESIAKGKPVIIFGLAWYEDYKGVLKICDSNSAAQIKSFIENYKFDENSLMAYLRALSNNSERAYYFRTLKEKMKQEESECIANLEKMILSKLNIENHQII